MESTVLWEGAQACSKCTSKVHSKWEPTAKAWVCAGCYNEFAYPYGWESTPATPELPYIEKGFYLNEYMTILIAMERFKVSKEYDPIHRSSMNNIINNLKERIEIALSEYQA